MSTTAIPNHEGSSVPAHDSSSSSDAVVVSEEEGPEAEEKGCQHGFLCQNEDSNCKPQVHENLVTVSSPDRSTQVHSAEIDAQCVEAEHCNSGIGQTSQQLSEAGAQQQISRDSVCENRRRQEWDGNHGMHEGLDDVFSEAGVRLKKKPGCRVAVVGAGGFIASWIVKVLLQRGFDVRGTLRHPDDENTAHLRSLEGAGERLELVKADILHLPTLVEVVEGCDGVFHTACPVLPTISDPEAQMLRPAVEGTLNVLKACAQAHVKRVVMTSSIGTVYMNPTTSPGQVFDENCWSDENYLKDTKEWYCLAKLMAERAAWDYANSHNLNLVTICPGVTLGTMLQPRMNQSSIHILKYLNGSTQTYANLCQAYVDVEDVAEAHVLAFVTQSASGRYVCCKWSRHRGQVVEALARMLPHHPIPTRCKDEREPKKVPLRFCNRKVEQQLGLQFTAFDQTLRNAVSSLQAKDSFGDHDTKLASAATKCTAEEDPAPQSNN